jgi:hypothetical protein
VSLRTPPVLATWLLLHLGPSYQKDSLAGDLFEEYQLGRTRAWYWKQSLTAIGIGQARRLPVIAAASLLALLTEAAAVLGAIACAEQLQQLCSVRAILHLLPLAGLAGTIGLLLSVGFYISVVGAARRRGGIGRKQSTMKRLMTAFAMTALSAGTLTWASSSSAPRCTADSCICHGGEAIASSKPALERGHP